MGGHRGVAFVLGATTWCVTWMVLMKREKTLLLLLCDVIGGGHIGVTGR